MGEKESGTEVRAKGMRMALAAMRVKAFEGGLQRAMRVGALLAGWRSSMELRDLEMRSSASAFGSRSA